MFALTILGNNSAVPAFDRNPTAQVLQMPEESFLIDCGEGTQLQMAKYKIKRSKISRVFISHLHGDHYFGLIGLLSTMSLLGRTQELSIYAPAALEEIIKLHLKVAETTELSYPIKFFPLQDEGIIVDDNKVTVECFKTQHRIECWGFLFREKKKHLRHVDRGRAESYEIPVSYFEHLQQGKDYTTKKGTVIPNEEVTTAAVTGKSYAYCADTLYDERLAAIAKGVDMLYHETTYLKNFDTIAEFRFHSTTVQAATIALKANAKCLLIGHFSSKYETLDEFYNETAAVFENTQLAIEGVTYIV